MMRDKFCDYFVLILEVGAFVDLLFNSFRAPCFGPKIKIAAPPPTPLSDVIYFFPIYGTSDLYPRTHFLPLYSDPPSPPTFK
jgi:hypothetical protein